MDTKKQIKNFFIEGPISAQFIGDAIAKHQSKTTIGAHQIFLGQVRADEINGKTVAQIDYSAYREMANKVFDEIREAAFQKYDLICSHIYHSYGKVKAGEICLFVFVSSAHRKATYKALQFIVEEIKNAAPIFGKELFEDETHVWKINK